MMRESSGQVDPLVVDRIAVSSMPLGRRLAPYRAILTARLRVLLQYRTAALAAFGTQLFWGVIKVMVLTAFLAAAPEAAPMDVPQVLV
jgi:hypothetical protein